MTASERYLAGLRAGWVDESMGILEPEHGYGVDDYYLAGVRKGREAWRRESTVALVVDAPRLGQEWAAWT